MDEFQLFNELDKRARQLYPEPIYSMQTGPGKFLYFSVKNNNPLIEFTVMMVRTNMNDYQLQVEEFDYRNKLI